MFPLLIASLLNNELWMALPLLVAISLVYGATRHELMQPILYHAYKSGVWIGGFMTIIFVVLLWASWRL